MDGRERSEGVGQMKGLELVGTYKHVPASGTGREYNLSRKATSLTSSISAQ